MFTIPQPYARAAAPIRTLFNDLFETSTPGLVPPLDFVETETTYVAHVELPGVEPGTIDVAIADGRLEIRGDKKAVTEKDGDNWHRVERRYGTFVRSVTLPGEVDAANVTAESKNGVLTITLPKREDTRARKISVTILRARVSSRAQDLRDDLLTRRPKKWGPEFLRPPQSYSFVRALVATSRQER